MANVKLHKGDAVETPSQAIVKAANTTGVVVDSIGRTLKIRKLKALDRMRLFEIVGADNAKNDVYFGYATLAYLVTEIDEEALPTISNKLQLEASVKRLDDEGLNAVAQYLSEQATAETEEGFKDKIKNA